MSARLNGGKPGCQQAVDGGEVRGEGACIVEDIGEVRGKIVGAVITHRWVGFDFVDGQRLKDIDAESDEVGNFRDDVEKRGGYPGRAGIVGSNVKLVDDHVGEIRRDKCRVVPWVGSGGADEAPAI